MQAGFIIIYILSFNYNVMPLIHLNEYVLHRKLNNNIRKIISKYCKLIELCIKLIEIKMYFIIY